MALYNTPIVDDTKTGNSVGKTTVLKLIDYCLGSDGKNIYTSEDGKVVYDLVKEYLINSEIVVTLVLTVDFHEDSEKIVIKRNFLPRKKKILTLNGDTITDEEKLGEELKKLIFNKYSDKPTFKQIKSHNIRYKEPALSSTLETLSRYSTMPEYETLYLFLLGCDFSEGDEKQRLNTIIKQELAFKSRLEAKETKTGYVSVLNQIENEIKELENKKGSFNINENFNNDLERLNSLKREIRHKGSLLASLNIKKDIILETQADLNEEVSKIDSQQLKMIYQQATDKINNIQKSFEELVQFHNSMLAEKVSFITKDLPTIESDIDKITKSLGDLKNQEKIVTQELSKSIAFQDLEKLISELNEKYRRKGEYEGIIERISEVEQNIDKAEKELDNINNNIFTESFKSVLQEQINKFNNKFSFVSKELYGEKFTIKFDIVEDKKTKKPVYKFSPTFTSNQSTGKKQGEIVCFDIAYIMFAEEDHIPHLKFLLNDRKELMHGNQLLNIHNLINDKNIQFVASILKDKLPPELQKEEYYVVELSQNDKLFRIES